MSGETEEAVSGWTVDTSRSDILRILDERELRYQERFGAAEKAVDSALAAADRAVAKAEGATEKRFEGVNEFRQQLADQARTFLPRQEYDARHESLVEALTAVTTRLTTLEGSKSGMSQTIAWGAVAFSAIVAVATIVVSIVTH